MISIALSSIVDGDAQLAVGFDDGGYAFLVLPHIENRQKIVSIPLSAWPYDTLDYSGWRYPLRQAKINALIQAIHKSSVCWRIQEFSCFRSLYTWWFALLIWVCTLSILLWWLFWGLRLKLYRLPDPHEREKSSLGTARRSSTLCPRNIAHTFAIGLSHTAVMK